MKASEIVVGGHYIAKVSNRLVTVRVDDIRTVDTYRRSSVFGKGQQTVYNVTNTATGRKTVFRSAAKFRSRAIPATPKVTNGQTETQPSPPTTTETVSEQG